MNVNGNMKGKVALVTGAGSGIGKATAVMLGGGGAKVGVLTHTESEAREAEQEIGAKGAKPSCWSPMSPRPGKCRRRSRSWSAGSVGSTSFTPMPASTASGRRSMSCNQRNGTGRSTPTSEALT